MKVIFLGFQNWGWESLKALLDKHYEIQLVITHPDSAHPYESIWNRSVKDLARSHSIKCLECKRVVDRRLIGRLRDLEPDVLIASDWRTILSQEVLEIPRLGGINIHDALLPKYGGFAPVNWAIIHGEEEVGITAHFMTEDVDLGDIICQVPIAVTPEMTATDVVNRIFPLVGQVTIDSLELIQRPDFKSRPQDKAQASFFRKRTYDDSRIDWQKPSRSVYNLIRAQSDPYPNAFAFHDGQRLKVKSARLSVQKFKGSPGQVFKCTKEGTLVVCGPSNLRQGSGNTVALDLIQIGQGSVVHANDYFPIGREVGVLM